MIRRRFLDSASRQRPKSDEERILPLINIVFLLLVVFMLAGQLTASDPFRVEPPLSSTEGQPKEQDTTILVGTDGRLALDGTVTEADALIQAIEARVARGDIGEVRLKADGQADAAQVVAVMELLRMAGVESLHLLAASGAH